MSRFRRCACSRIHSKVQQAERIIAQRGIGKPGDVVVYVGGTELDAVGNVNSLKVRRLGDTSLVGA